MNEVEMYVDSVKFLVKQVDGSIQLHVSDPNSKVFATTDKPTLRLLAAFLNSAVGSADQQSTSSVVGHVAVVEGIHKERARTSSSMLDDDPAGGLVVPRQYTTPTTGGYGNS